MSVRRLPGDARCLRRGHGPRSLHRSSAPPRSACASPARVRGRLWRLPIASGHSTDRASSGSDNERERGDVPQVSPHLRVRGGSQRRVAGSDVAHGTPHPEARPEVPRGTVLRQQQQVRATRRDVRGDGARTRGARSQEGRRGEALPDAPNAAGSSTSRARTAPRRERRPRLERHRRPAGHPRWSRHRSPHLEQSDGPRSVRLGEPAVVVGPDRPRRQVLHRLVILEDAQRPR